MLFYADKMIIVVKHVPDWIGVLWSIWNITGM